MLEVDALMQQGRAVNATACFADLNLTVQLFAISHAYTQAKQERQGHQRWGERFERLQGCLSGYTFQEVCAESWPEQVNCSPEELAVEMFKCWKQSSGHWSALTTPADVIGGHMALGDNGIWYACIIMGRKL